eukprot:11760-Amphidinium_carterae.1
MIRKAPVFLSKWLVSDQTPRRDIHQEKDCKSDPERRKKTGSNVRKRTATNKSTSNDRYLTKMRSALIAFERASAVSSHLWYFPGCTSATSASLKR